LGGFWILLFGVAGLIAALVAILLAPPGRRLARIFPALLVVIAAIAISYALIPAVALLARPLEWINDDYIPFVLAAIFAALMAIGFVGMNILLSPRARDVSPPKPKPPRQKKPAAAGKSGPPDVFISYKRDERGEVLAIARRLEALKLRVWFDAEMRSGTTFDSEIDRQVRSAKAVLVCWSPGAVASDWVRGEATIGRQRGVLAAALLKACDLPAPFNLVHTDDLTRGIGPGNPDWLRVVERIGALAGRPGLAAFEALETGATREACAAWIAANASDPLLDAAVERLKQIQSA
jgi:hypothetical protein